MANPWEQDWEPQGQQSTGAPWEQDYDLKDDPAKRALPDGVQPSTVAGGRGNVNPEPVRQMPAGLKPTEYGLSDVQPTVTASTGQAVQPDARKRESVLEDHPASRPWDMRSTIKARADIEAMPQARPEASMQETPLPTQIGMDLRNSVTNPAARGVVAGLAGLGTVIPGAIQAGADLLGADGVGDYAGRVARTGEQITSPMRPNAGGEKLVFDIANSITQTAPTLIVGLGGGPAMAALFGQSAAQEYTQGRSAGLDGGRAAARAGIMAGAEVLGERFGFSEQLKILKGLANRVPAEELAPVFARQIMKEIPGEQLTTLIQFLGDKVGPGALNPEATLADYLQQAGDTLKVTIGQTAVMGGAPVAINAARQHLKKPVDRTPQIKALRAQGDEVAAAHMEQRAQKEQAAYSADVEAGALANFSPELAQRYRETRITGAKMGDAVVQTAARWNFEQAAQVAGLTPKAQQAIADAITQLPPEKVPGFVQKAITGLVEAGVAQPFDGMDQIAANIEAQRDQMLDSVLGAMDDINQLEAQQDGAQDTADATTVQAPDAGAPQALGAEQGAGEGPGIAESALPDGRTEQEQALTGEWQQFPQETETMGVPRAEMPQVKTVHRGPLVNFLGARGVTSEQVEVDPADLKPTQAEFSQTKVQEAADRDTDRSILISSDGYIIDGHHQAIAKLQNGKPVRAIRLGAPAADLLPLVREFPSSTTDQSSDEQNATQPSGNAGQVAQAQAVEAPTPARGDGAAAAGVPATPGAGDVQADGVVATVPEDRFGNMPDVSKNTPNLNTSAEPAQKTAESEQVELLGRNSQPMSEGAKPFKTQAEAKKEKKLHPTMRVVKSKDGKGYVLAPKTAKQIAAMERAAKNIKGVSTGEAGPQSLHHFILSQGGLAFESMADAGFDKNQRIGNRWLFSKTGKTLAKMSEALKDAGFITEETENAVSEGLRRSLVNPVYTSDGYEAMARAEAETRFEDHLAAQQEAPEAVDENADGFDPFASGSTLVDLDFVPDDIKATGYDEAELQKRQEFAALLAAAEAEGIDVDSIQELAYENARNGTDDDYRNEARAFIAAARSSRAQAAERSSAQQGRTDAERRSGGDVREGNGQESATQDAGAGQSLTQQPDGTLAVTGDPDALKQRLTDAGIPAKSVLKSKTGVVVGKTQADKAREVLDPPALTAPTKADIEAQQVRAEQAARDKAAADRAAERTAAQQEERKRIAKASEQAADTFELGGDAMANLTGQQDIFAAAPTEPTPPAGPKTDLFSGNKVFTADKVEAARARLRAKLNQLNSGIDPEVVIDGMTIAGAYIEAGVRKFSDYAKAMTDDFGDSIKPYLLSFYEAARNYPGIQTDGMTIVEQARAEHAALLKTADTAPVAEALGETVAKPAKRTKKTGAKTDMTLTQDWGMEHIDAYSDDGEQVKAAFLKEAKTYLSTVAGILAEQGFTPYTDAKGRPEKAVSVNESGVATSGDVTMTLAGPNGIGLYAHIGGTSLRGAVPTTASGVSLMVRVAQDGDKFGVKDRNRWMPVDLSAADVAISMQTAVSEFKPKGAQDAATLQTQPVPARDTGESAPDAAAGDGDRQPVGTGVAGSRQGAAEGGQVPGGADGAGAGGTRGFEPAGQRPSGPARDRAGVRPDAGSADNAADFVIDADEIGKGGLTKKYRDNVSAIRILKTLEAEGRVATPDERKQLAKYVGWGAMKGPFDPENKQWAKQHAELKELLTDAEFRAARKSTLDAHYTSPIAVGAMNDALARLGYKGGRMLEPSVGVGNFYGLMPAGVRNASQLYGVELDSLTSRMVAALYPKAKIAKATGFEDFQIPAEFFDLVQGNPPFGNQPLVDGERSPYSGFSIHNYFLAKGIDKLRPGGIMQVVVSHSFLDAQDSRARKWINERASLIGAVRLPNTAFQENAGTSVVTDILIFQKHDANGLGRNDIVDDWMDVVDQVNVNPKTGESVTHKVSPIFVKRPDLVLGKTSAGGTMYAPNQYTVEATGDIKAQLGDWVQTLPENIYTPIERKPEAATDMAVPDGVKVGSYYVDQAGEIMQRGDDVMGAKTARTWVSPNAKTAERMKGMIGLREALRAQMRLERSPDASEAEIEANRATLNKLYDDFLKKHGHVNSQTNRRLFLDDTEAQLIQALEFDYDKGISKAMAEKEGIEQREPSATKADIFKRRVAFPPQDFLTVTTAKDALLASLNYRGKVDPGYMAEVYGKPMDEIVKELGEVVFDDPQAGIVTADEYLSGDVKTKLAEAKAAAQGDAKYRRNVEALEKVIPADKKPSEITVSIGAAFVPAVIYEKFVKHISGGSAAAVYIKATGQWVMDFKGGTESALNSGRFGTDQLSAQELFQLSMLGRGAVVKRTVRNPDGSTTTILMEKETEAAREKQNAIKAEWQSWLWSDAARAEQIAALYNEKLNRIVERTFDGAHLSFPGMNPAITLLEHQKNGVWRGLQSYQVLYDHVVGAGKTFEMATLAMEMRRLGISRKPLFVVPNHLTLQWRSEFTRLYPGSNILAATPEDFSKDNRERLFSKIITGDWDAVVIGHSSLKKIGLPEDTEKAVLQEQIDEVAQAIEDIKRSRGDRNIIRDMEGIRARLEAKMKDKLAAIGKRSKVVTFDELGIDAMFIDEMHEFKNLAYNSTMDRNPGMGNPAGSAKAFDLFVKTRWLFDTFGEKTPYITATGTPVSNSLVEMFNMQRYMQYPTLKAQGLHVFDAWAKQFGSVENVYEVAPSGSGYRQSTRFSKFANLPGLMSLYNSFADTITLDDLKAQEEAQGKRFPVPKMVGGKPQIVVAQRSPAVANLMGVPMAQTDEAGQIKFLVDLNGRIQIDQKPDTGKWTAKVGETYLGEFDTEQDARLKIVERAVTPEVSVAPESILGRFGRLKELTKETKGKVNALSLTGEANKAGLDYRLVNPGAPDFPGSKINLAVDNMVRIYKQWAADKGAQLVFCDLSIPLSARASYSSKARRLYVRDEAGAIEMKRGTMHTLEGQESLPYFVVQRGEKDLKRFDVYDAASGVKIGGDLRTKQDAIDQANTLLADASKRQHWIDRRETAGEISQEAIDEYNNENDIEADGIEAFTREDIAGVSGAAKFSVYDDIKAKLIAKGVPEREIAFIHDYATPTAKDKLFKAVNAGEVRFLLGSTPKMGAGTNVQKRLVGLHHIDAPWRPSDLEQREGRIIRRGNELYARDPDGFEVFIGRYATEQTYDTRRWQILEHKARGIEQLRNFDGTINEIDDIEGEAANAADMKAAASGDPLILEETRLRNDVRRLEQLQAAHADDVLSMNRKARFAEDYAKTSGPRQLAEVQALADAAKKHKLDKDGFAPITIDGKTFDTKEAAQKQIEQAVSVVRASMREEAIIVYRGVEFTVSLPYSNSMVADSPTGELGKWFTNDPFSASGFVQRLKNYVDRLPAQIENIRAGIEKAEKDAVAMREQAKAPFGQAADLEAAREAYKRVQRALLAKGPSVPESQKPAVAAGIEAQKNRLEALGFGEAIREVYQQSSDGLRFSQGLLAPESLGPKPTLDQVQRLVDKIQQVAKNVLPISVVSDPSQIAGLDVPVGTKPSGALIDGRVYLFADNLKSTGDAYVTLFHELFHLGLQKVIPAEDYAALLTQFAKDPLVQRYVMMWKESAEGRQKAGTMNAAAYDALAAEEALAMVSEELAASDNMGSRKLPELVKAVLSWMAKVADRVGMPASFSDWMRGLSRTDAEKFVSDMIRAAMGGPNNLARVRSKYGTQVQALSSQTRLSAIDAADRLAGLSPEARQVDMLAPNVWSAPEPTRTDRVIYELQDGRIDLKRVQEAIKEAGAAIPEKFDARLAETLYPGRVATRAQRFLDDEVKPLLEAMARNNVEMDELADYLHARGAKERNAQMAKVNPDLPDGGSGKNSKGVLMTNAAADAHLALISPTRKMALDAMARRVDAITKGTRQLLVAEGLEKQETIDAWEKAYKNYVPMFRDEAESGNPHPTGNGMSVRGSASKRATGSTKQVTNILAHVLMQREAAITRAEKNRVAVALYGLALSNPNRDFWTTIRPGMKPEKIAEELERMGVDPAVAVAGMSGAPTITTVDPTLGVKVSRPNPIYKSLPGAITVRINGEDRVLMLNTTDPRGARMAENLKNLDGLTKIDIAGSLIGKTTRWMASVNTQYNPAFGLVNLIRDTVGGSINLTSTPLRGKTLKVLALTAPALKGIALELSGRPSGEWGKLFRQFQADGGQTGYRDQFKDASERTKLIAAELKQFEKAGQLTPGKVAHKILDALDIFNTTLENAVRLAAYREGLLEGMSRPAAARLGRELTVDFNRKGRIGREAGPLYAFFNVGVQSSARMIETIRGPDGNKIIYGGLMLGVMQAIMLLAAGYDDDEIPEFVKSRALIIPLPWMEGKEYLAIPLTLGLHVLPNTGRVLAELTLDGGRDAGGKLFNALGEIAGAFNPLGGGNIFTPDGFLKTLAPTVLDPIIEMEANKNFAGKPIEREKFGDNDQRPGFERAREGTQRQPTGQAYIEISRVINKLTGGDDYEAGKYSPTPEMIRYLAQVAGGGLLRETEKIINTTFDVARGEDVKPTGVPIFGRLYGEVDDESVQRTRFYDNLRRIERAENVLNAAAKKGDLSRAEQVMADIPEVMLGKAARDAKSSVSKLNNAAAQTIGDREMSKALDEARTGVMRGLNEVAAEIDRPRREATVGAKLKQAIGLSDAR